MACECQDCQYRKALVVLGAQKLRDYLHEISRDHGAISKALGLGVDEFRMIGFEVFGEAHAELKALVEKEKR